VKTHLLFPIEVDGGGGKQYLFIYLNHFVLLISAYNRSYFVPLGAEAGDSTAGAG